jgi:hypothetical protein
VSQPLQHTSHTDEIEAGTKRERVDVTDLEGQAGNSPMHPTRFLDEGRIDIHTDYPSVWSNGGGNVPSNGPGATPQVKDRQTRP